MRNLNGVQRAALFTSENINKVIVNNFICKAYCPDGYLPILSGQPPRFSALLS
jgi:hypothetical protein